MADNTPPPAQPITSQPAPTDITSPPPLNPAAPQAPPAQPTPPPRPTGQTPTLDVTQAAETFKALNALFEEQDKGAPAPVNPLAGQTPAPTTTPPGQAATGETPPAPTPVGTDLQKQLDAISAPAGAHPNVGAGIDQLKKIAAEQGSKVTTYETQLKELQAKVQTYEAAQKEGKLPEQTQKEIDELRAFRREVDMRQDPDFQTNYIKPVQATENEIMGLLEQVGVTEETMKFIQENGGAIAVSQSQEKANDKQTLAEWLESSILGRINTVTRNRILSKLAGASDIIDKGQRELADWRENGQKRYEAKMHKIAQEFESGRDEAIAELGDLGKVKTIDASDTAEIRQEKEAHNALLREAGTQYDELLKISQQPKTAGHILVKATQAKMLMKMYNEEKTKNTQLQERLDRIKVAGGHSAAGDHTPPPGQTPPSMGDLLKKPTEQALTELFNQAGVTR